MRCRKARRILGQDAEDPGSLSDDLRAHLASCAACAQFAEQLGRIWAALGAAPEISPAAGFTQRVLARVQADEVPTTPVWRSGRVLGWQWMTLAASALILALILIPGTMAPDPAQSVTVADQWDDSFLEALDSSLEQPDYLPTYDTWAEEAAAPPADAPTVEEDPGGVRHGKS